MTPARKLAASAALLIGLGLVVSLRPAPVAARAAAAEAACAWAPDLSGGPLDVTFYVTSDSEIGRGRPVSEYVRYQRELVEFARSQASWPAGFRGAGTTIAPPTGIITTGDNIFGGPGGEYPLLWLIQRLRFEWLWSRSRGLPPLDVFVDPSILDIEPISYPVYPGLGNHDWDVGALQNGEATLLDHMRDVIPGCWGVTNFHAPSGNYSWNWGRLHLVQLNEWAGARDPDGLTWLREDLRRIGAEAPVLMFQHYGFDGFSRQPVWWNDDDRQMFLDVVCDYNVLGIVSGHTHHAFPADQTPVSCPPGRKLAGLRNFIGEDGILFNADGSNLYFGDPPQGTGTFMVFRVVDDGSAAGSFMDVATVSWRRDAESGVDIRHAQNGYDFIQSFPIATEAPSSFRNLDLGAWQHLGGSVLGAAAPLALPDGRAVVFAVGRDFRIWARFETTPGAWSEWVRFGTRPTRAVSTARLVSGLVLVLALEPGGAITATRQQPDGSFSPWQRIGSSADVFVSAPQVAVLPDGRVEVHAVRFGGALFRTRTAASGWEAWQSLGGPVAGGGVVGTPALVGTSDGRLAVVVRGSDGLSHFNRRLAQDAAWSGWTPLGMRAISSDVTAAAAGTVVDVFARDAVTRRVWAARLDLDSGAVSETVLDGPTTIASAPTAGFDRHGELRLVVTDGTDLLWTRRRPGEAWIGWNRLPRQRVLSRPALLPIGDGRVSLYATAGPGGELLRITELASWAAQP